MGNFEKGRPSIFIPSHIILSAYGTGQHRWFIQYGELLSRSEFFHENHDRFWIYRACIYEGSFIRVPPWPIRILYRNLLLNLGTRENRHEQSVNFSKKQRHFLKNLGCIVKGFDDVTITRTPAYHHRHKIFQQLYLTKRTIFVLTYGRTS